MIQINWFDELFLSTDMWGWFGPLGFIVISFIILTDEKKKPLGILFLIIEILIINFYLGLVDVTPWYWWNIIILIMGMLICIAQLTKR